jgi:hypothetical protein
LLSQSFLNIFPCLFINFFYRVLVRLAIYRAANVRILTNGGVSAFEGLHASSLMGGGHQQEQRARQVFGAFASFREKHCFVPVGDEDTPGEARGPTAAAAAAAAAPQDETKKERTDDGVGDTKHTSITDADRLIKAERRDDIVDATEEERLVEKNKETADVGGGNVNDRPQDEDERLLLWWDRPAARKVPRQMGDSPGPLQPGLRRLQSAAALSLLGQKTGVAQAMAAKLLVSGEILHVLRPLIYVSALRRWGRRSWKPWLISLVTELVAARLTSMGADVSRKSAMQAAEDPAVVGTAMARLYALQGLRWRHDEADEFLRRRAALLLYLLRDPFFSNLTGPAVMRWKGRLGRLPVVGWGVEKAAELLVGVQKYYTYVGSS